MKRKASPTLIGAFVVGGLALIAAVLLAVVGDDVFKQKDRVVMHFGGSVYGLQVGAPVVFRGVRIGSVTAIGLRYDGRDGRFTIPVQADIERSALTELAPQSQGAGALRVLIARGLNAQLAMQSLLTGLLYVDLDLRPTRETTALRGAGGGLEIPTSPTTIQNLKEQLDSIDFARITRDLSAIAESVRNLAAGERTQRLVEDVTQTAANLRQLSDRLARQVGPLATEARGTLADARGAIERLARAAEGVQDTAGRFGATAERASALLAPESPLMRQLDATAAELAATAAALRSVTAPEGALLQDTQRTLADVGRAARALRELALVLEQNPEALLRGRPAEPRSGAAEGGP